MSTQHALDLQAKHCVPCEGGVPPLASRQIDELMPAVPDWSDHDRRQALATDMA